MSVNLNYTQIDWTDGSGAKGSDKGQISFSVLDQLLYIGLGDSVLEFHPIQNAFSGNYADLNGLPDLSVFETTTQLNARSANDRIRTNHTGTQPISSIDGLQTALDASATGGQDFEYAANTFNTLSGAVVEIPHGLTDDQGNPARPSDFEFYLKCIQATNNIGKKVSKSRCKYIFLLFPFFSNHNM